jgi:hypothetical protein
MKNLLILFTILFTSCSKTYYTTSQSYNDPIYNEIEEYKHYEEDVVDRQTETSVYYISYFRYYNWELGWWNFRSYNYNNWNYWNFNNFYWNQWNNPYWNYSWNPYWNNPYNWNSWYNHPYSWNNPYWNYWGCNPYLNSNYYRGFRYQGNFRNTYFGHRYSKSFDVIRKNSDIKYNKINYESANPTRNYQTPERTQPYYQPAPQRAQPSRNYQPATQPSRNYQPSTQPSRNYQPAPQRAQPSRNYQTAPQRIQPSRNYQPHPKK